MATVPTARSNHGDRGAPQPDRVRAGGERIEGTLLVVFDETQLPELIMHLEDGAAWLPRWQVITEAWLSVQ